MTTIYQNKKNSSIKGSNSTSHLINLIILILGISFVPLIVHMKIIPLSGDSYYYWLGNKQDFDFFSYYKGIAIILLASATLITATYSFFKDGLEDFKWNSMTAPLLVYVIFVLISTMLSDHHDVAMKGFPARYEGMWVILSYIILALLASVIVRSNREGLYILSALMISGVIIALIGIAQYLGFDFWLTNIGKWIAVPSKYAKDIDKLEFALGAHSVFSTLYHNDYVGSYAAMLLPLSFTAFIAASNRLQKVTFAIITLIMIAFWIVANSRAGIVGGLVSLVLLSLVLQKQLLSHWKYLIVAIVLTVLIAVGLNKVTHGFLLKRIGTLINDAVTFVTPNSGNKSPQTNIPIKDIKINQNTASVITDKGTISIKIDSDRLIFLDEKNNPIEAGLDPSSNQIIFKNEKYLDYKFWFDNYNGNKGLHFQYANLNFDFMFKDNAIVLVDNMNQPIPLKPVESWGFKGKESLGSARGYIWSRTIPLLKDTLIIGHGPDTFPMYFPQYDIMGKLSAYGDPYIIVDKPHNLYLQIALSTGILSLLVLIISFGWYIMQCIRIYHALGLNEHTWQGIAVFSAVTGYLVAGFFNDSVVSVAPVFWILFGSGLAINFRVKQEFLSNTVENHFI